MPTTADMIMTELEEAGNDLLNYGTHEGTCTNEAQMKIAQKIAPCSKHTSTLKKREERFRQALEQMRLLRDVFA